MRAERLRNGSCMVLRWTYRWSCDGSMLTSQEHEILQEGAAFAERMVAAGGEWLGLGAPGTAQPTGLGGAERPLCRRRVRLGVGTQDAGRRDGAAWRARCQGCRDGYQPLGPVDCCHPA